MQIFFELVIDLFFNNMQNSNGGVAHHFPSIKVGVAYEFAVSKKGCGL